MGEDSVQIMENNYKERINSVRSVKKKIDSFIRDEDKKRVNMQKEMKKK